MVDVRDADNRQGDRRTNRQTSKQTNAGSKHNPLAEVRSQISVHSQICTIFYPDAVPPIRIVCSSCRRRQACYNLPRKMAASSVERCSTVCGRKYST